MAHEAGSKVNHLPQTLVLNATKMVLVSKYSLLHYNNCNMDALFCILRLEIRGVATLSNTCVVTGSSTLNQNI